jgi:hypothetical protein
MVCTRRTFFMAAAGATLAARGALAGQSANDRIRIGVIGTGGRARGLMQLLKRLPGNEMVAVCDVYEPRMLQAPDIATAASLKTDDYRRILDNREIDAVVIGTPDPCHKTITLAAVAAGKDVYVEKPVSHTITEGEELVRASRGRSRSFRPARSSAAGITGSLASRSWIPGASARSRSCRRTGISTRRRAATRPSSSTCVPLR